MQIHIWQQFSSNHSADFEVVGKFDSVESAKIAADTIKAMFDTITTWLLESADADYYKRRRAVPDSQIPPTQPEIDFGKEYGVEWKVGLNWLMAGGEGLAEPVMQFRDLVIVRPKYYYTWQGPQPIDQILAKLGAEVAVFQEQVAGSTTSYLLIDITFAALHQSTANKIQAQLEHTFQILHAEIGDDTNIPIPFDYINKIRRDDLRFYELERNGLNFKMYGVMFLDSINIGLQAVINYLESKDCYNIDYHFQTIQIEPEN